MNNKCLYLEANHKQKSRLQKINCIVLVKVLINRRDGQFENIIGVSYVWGKDLVDGRDEDFLELKGRGVKHFT